jgi:hypothetical protein
MDYSQRYTRDNKKIAITDVNLVKKSPAEREDIRLSFPAPIPSAPPSDLCNKTDPISKIAITI